jgi:hypothetical protein
MAQWLWDESGEISVAQVVYALRQARDEATKAENDGIGRIIANAIAHWAEVMHTDDGEIYGEAKAILEVLSPIASAIRARLPEGGVK